MNEITLFLTNLDFNWNVVECVAVFFSILYVLLASKENIWCWGAGAISVSLYMYINYDLGYYAQSLLQIFYLIMSIYGYIIWNKVDAERIKEWSPRKHLIIIFIGTILTFIFGFILKEYAESSEQPILDALTTIFSVFSTYMVVKKVLENWLYWIIIDALLVYLYYIQEAYILSLQFVVYIIIAIFGYFSWMKKMKRNA
jgi:nicotinamide mononucleotide transporter